MLKQALSMRGLAVANALALATIVILVDAGRLTSLVSLVKCVRGGDKLAHFALMGMLAFTVSLALGWSGRRDEARAAIVGARGVFAVVFLEELSQRWIATRTFDVLDLTADAAGILVGAWLSYRWLRRRARSFAFRIRDA